MLGLLSCSISNCLFDFGTDTIQHLKKISNRKYDPLFWDNIWNNSTHGLYLQILWEFISPHSRVHSQNDPWRSDPQVYTKYPSSSLKLKTVRLYRWSKQISIYVHTDAYNYTLFLTNEIIGFRAFVQESAVLIVFICLPITVAHLSCVHTFYNCPLLSPCMTYMQDVLIVRIPVYGSLLLEAALLTHVVFFKEASLVSRNASIVSHW